jgi:hypothetical protein
LRISRDGVIFLLGVAGIIYESAIGKGERPTLILLFGGCLGLPVFLHADQGLIEPAAIGRRATRGNRW